MFRKHNGQFMTAPPATVVVDGFVRKFAELTREQWDALGYNEAVAAKREPFAEYRTEWIKGDDLIYREQIVSEEVDEEARAGHAAQKVRTERNRLLSESDWTQLPDRPLTSETTTNWATYRQALRDISSQAGFPLEIDWPTAP